MNGNRSAVCGFLRGQTREHQEVADGRIQDEDQDRKRRTAGDIESTGGRWSLPVGVEVRWAGWYQWCPLFQEVAALPVVCQISLANPLLNWAAGPLISLCRFASRLRPHIAKGLTQDADAHN